jgi:hypothetical protein
MSDEFVLHSEHGEITTVVIGGIAGEVEDYSGSPGNPGDRDSIGDLVFTNATYTTDSHTGIGEHG